MIEPVQLPSPWRDARLTVVVPTYNEAGNIPVLVERLLALPLPGLSILIADDNSPDGTGEIADKLAIEHPDRIQVVHRPGKEGLGRAYVDGISRALDGGAEYVAQMDADLSHPPEALPGMLGSLLSTRAGVVIGSRYVPGGQLDEAWPFYRRALSGWANFYVHTLLQVRIRDLTAGFKIWRADALRDIGLERVQSNGYSFQVEMHYLATKLGHTILEVPIRFQERLEGDSKMTTATKIESALMPFKLRGRHRNITRTDGRSATFRDGMTTPAAPLASPADAPAAPVTAPTDAATDTPAAPSPTPADTPAAPSPTPADTPAAPSPTPADTPAAPSPTPADTPAAPSPTPETPPAPDNAQSVTAATLTATEEPATATPPTSTATKATKATRATKTTPATRAPKATTTTKPTKATKATKATRAAKATTPSTKATASTPSTEVTSEEISDAPDRPTTGEKVPEKKPDTTDQTTVPTDRTTVPTDRTTVPASRTTKRRPTVPKESAS